MEKDRKIKILLMLFAVMAVITVFSAYNGKTDGYEYAGRELTEEEQQEIIERNSKLTEYVRISPHADFPRTGKIQKITIHHMAGDYTLKEVGKDFSYKDRDASANYGIDSEGRVGLYVEEANRSWASADKENDNVAVTIEVANDEAEGEWHVSDEAFNTLIDLCVDICRRNNIEKLVFTGDPEGNLTYHKMFSEDTSCPGPYLISRMGDIERLVNEKLEK